MPTERSGARRYGTAAALAEAEDVERHLTRRPVSARPPTLAYRLGRAVVRHKPASAFALSLVLFAATAAWQIDQQRDRAEALSGFLKSLFRGADPEQTRSEATSRPPNPLSARRSRCPAVAQLQGGKPCNPDCFKID